MHLRYIILFQLVIVCSGGLIPTSLQQLFMCPWINCTLKCRAFEYQVGEYRLRLKFREENVVFWEYLSAPNGLTGKNATEQVEATQMRADTFILRWKEADGSQIIDVLDLGRMIMYANFVLSNGERFSAQAQLKAVRGDC